MSATTEWMTVFYLYSACSNSPESVQWGPAVLPILQQWGRPIASFGCKWTV